MSGGGTTVTTGDVPAALRPLYESSINAMSRMQQAAPVESFAGRNPRETAPLSPLERHSIGQSYGLFNPSGMQGLALQDILSMPDLAAAGPTTGRYEPSNLGIRSYMDFVGGPQYGAAGEDYGAGGIYGDRAPFGPNPGGQ